MTHRNVLDFKQQAEQMLEIIEERLDHGQEAQAMELLILKFKALYEIGVKAGILYEREGTSPYRQADRVNF